MIDLPKDSLDSDLAIPTGQQHGRISGMGELNSTYGRCLKEEDISRVGFCLPLCGVPGLDRQRSNVGEQTETFEMKSAISKLGKL